ncbi:hypothetical protein ACFSRY_00140 [Pontibacter locisalis]|uniref:Uncharacterized protein n=1 Tax=Pontibacter locisalis TaxID=1719035 RepID=A0ABW5IFA8_9BACT
MKNLKSFWEQISAALFILPGPLHIVDGGNLLVSGPVGKQVKESLLPPSKGKLNLKHEVEPERTYTRKLALAPM